MNVSVRLGVFHRRQRHLLTSVREMAFIALSLTGSKSFAVSAMSNANVCVALNCLLLLFLHSSSAVCIVVGTHFYSSTPRYNIHAYKRAQ